VILVLRLTTLAMKQELLRILVLRIVAKTILEFVAKLVVPVAVVN
jgi:hypothetical protein